MASNKRNNKKELMLEALEKSLGIVSTACKVVGISRKTHYEWMKVDAEYNSAVKELDAVALDFAESKLHKLINDLNPSAIIFYMKTKGKHRGYIERQEIDVNPYKEMSEEELDARITDFYQKMTGNDIPEA